MENGRFEEVLAILGDDVDEFHIKVLMENCCMESAASGSSAPEVLDDEAFALQGKVLRQCAELLTTIQPCCTEVQ